MRTRVAITLVPEARRGTLETLILPWRWREAAQPKTVVERFTDANFRSARRARADVIVHRGCFEASTAEAEQVGLFSLLPAVVDAVELPVVA
jgi:hypothetical protein